MKILSMCFIVICIAICLVIFSISYATFIIGSCIDCNIGKPLIERPKNVIIDTDAGADDAIAILTALAYEASFPNDFKILAITCVYGNTYERNVVQNVLKTLTIANRSDIPVYSGAQKPFLYKYFPSNYFGSDGFGDFIFDEKLIAKVDNSKHASVALVDLAKQYSDISVLSIGPLTNIAMAIALDPLFPQYIKNFFIMGSSTEGVGNVRPNVEFNFSHDPESNFLVLNSTKEAQSIIFPWETVMKSSIPKEWRINVLGKIDSRVINFLNHVEKVDLERPSSWTPSDAMLVAAVIQPRFIIKSTITNVSPVFDGSAKGSVLVDYANQTSKIKNSIIIQEFNETMFQELLLDILP